VFARISSGAQRRGGILGYPLKTIHEEIAFIAYHFHWSADSILNLEHEDRRKWVAEISTINEQKNAEANRGADA
jgi:hypothetical protein